MIRALIDLYILILIVNVILSYVPKLSRNQIVVQIRKIAVYSCNPIRRALPKDQPFDFSPVAVILILNLIKVLW